MSYSNKKYASIYDSLYSNKNYVKEVNYIIKNIKKKNKSAKNILDLGCGTGTHAHLFGKKGYKTVGVDLSKSMINEAKKKYKLNKNLKFIHHDLKKLNLKKKFDVVVALFDILSFQISNSEVSQFFKIINRHINKGGLIFFDFWFKNTVIKIKPSQRTKMIKNKRYKIIRITNPNWNKNKNIIKVNYKMLIQNRLSKKLDILKGFHIMRYYALKEISKYLKNYNIKLLKYLTILDNKIKKNSWSVFVIAKKS